MHGYNSDEHTKKIKNKEIKSIVSESQQPLLSCNYIFNGLQLLLFLSFRFTFTY